MEKYVLPPFFDFDFKFPSINKEFWKEVKFTFSWASAVVREPAGAAAVRFVARQRLVYVWSEAKEANGRRTAGVGNSAKKSLLLQSLNVN